MRRRRKILISSASALVIAVLATPLWLPLVTDLAEPIIRREVLSIASDLLEPQVEIGRLDYSFPLGIQITNLRMISRDDREKEVVILDAPKVDITLDRLPILAGPLVFRTFEIEDVKIQLLAETSGAIVGWSDLLKGDDSSRSPASSGDDPRPVSEIFSIDHISVEDLTVEYALVDNPNRMVLDGLDFEIDNQGKNGSQSVDLEKGPGWYAIDTVLQRSGLFKIHIDGGLDIDTLKAEVAALDIDAKIDETSIGFLPPQLQTVVRDRRIRGQLDASVKGSFSLDDPRSDDTTFSIQLHPTSMAIDEHLVELDKASLDGRYRDEILVFDPIEVTLFDGTARGTVRIADETNRGLTPVEIDATLRADAEQNAPPTSESSEVTAGILDAKELAKNYVPSVAFDKGLELATGVHLFASIDLDGIDLSRIHRINPSDPQKTAGKLSAGVELDTNLGRPLATLGGGGELEVVDGRFTGGPLVKALAGVMRIVTLSPTQKDWLTSQFQIREERIRITRIEGLAGPIGFRGRGSIGFDGQVDLEVNSGPLEGLQATSGAIGRLTSLITDRFITYVVTGPIRNPRIRVAPLGIRFDRPK